MYIFLTVIIVILLAFIFEINKKKYYKLKRVLKFAISLPGAPILISFVDSLKIAFNYEELILYLEATTKKYGSLTRFILATDMYIILSKPEDYKLVLSNENGNNKTTATKLWETFFGQGIIRISGTAHKLRRKMLQPLLNLKTLSEYVTIFDTYSNLSADTLEKNVDGPIFDLKPYIAQYAFNLFVVTTVGRIPGTVHKSEDEKMMYWNYKLLSKAYNRMKKPWQQIEWIFSLTETSKQMYTAQKYVLDFICNMLPREAANHTVLQDNEMFQNSKPIFNNYMNHIKLYNNATDKSSEVSDEDIIDDLRNFLVAIQSTVSEIISFIMLMLVMHTEVQEKLREEILVTFNDNEIDAQRLFRMEYFRMVYQETLRLFPIAPMLTRQLAGDIKLESCTLPEGCYIMIPIFAIHRNPMYWHKPLEFIPERFLSENSSNRQRYTYIPFGTGLRDCLGQRYAYLSTASMIVHLLRRYRFINTNKYKNINDVKITSDITLRAPEVKLSISSL